MLKTMKKFIIFLILIFYSIVSFPQEKIVNDVRFYKDTISNKFYLNKNLPMHLWLASDKNGNDKVKLTSQSSPQYSNPFYFDTEGYNTVRTPSQVDTVTKKVVLPRTDIIFEIYADGLPPQTIIDFGKVPIFINDMKFVGKNYKINLKANDAISGVFTTYISLDSCEFQNYKFFNSDIMLTESLHFIQYYSEDNVGNHEDTKFEKVIIDITAPNTNIKLATDFIGSILSNRSYLNLEATDELSGIKNIYYAIDNDNFIKYKNPLNFKKLTDGRHVLKYYAVDNLKNKEHITI